MSLAHSFIVCFLLLVVQQGPQEKIRSHYEAAEAARLAGNLETAETEYGAILGEAYQRMGRISAARSDYVQAIAFYETAQRYRADTLDLQLDLAIAYFEAQQYEKAKQASEKLIAVAADNAGAHQMLGKSYFMLGNLDQAIVELETASKLVPDDIDVAYTLGVSYLRNRQSEKAKQLYAALLKSFGARPQLHIVIGRAYRQSGLLADAAEEFKQAIAIDPNFPRAHYYLGLTYLLDEGQSKIAEALEEFKIEAAANPDEFLANYYLGVVYNYQRQWEPAIASLQKAATIQPNNPDAYFQLGQSYQELNRHQEAIDALRKSIAFNPNLAHNKGQVTTAHHRLAQSLMKTGQNDAGQKELQIASELKAQAFKLEQQSPNNASGMGGNSDPESHPLAAVSTLDEKSKQELQRSEEYYKKVIGTAHNNIGLLRGQRQLFPGAAEQFELAAKWDPQQERLQYNLGLAYYKSQDYQRAAPPLENEVRSHPENRAAVTLLVSALMQLGKTLLKQGDKTGAIAKLEQATKLAPDSADAHYELGQAYTAAGRKSDGQKELDLSQQLRTSTPKQ